MQATPAGAPAAHWRRDTSLANAPPPRGAGSSSPLADQINEPLPAVPASAFPPAEARAARTSDEARRLAWRVLGAAFGAWLLLVAGAAYGLVLWFQQSTVQADATLHIAQGIVLFQERDAARLLNARDGMRFHEGDTLEVKDNSLARLEIPGHATLHLSPGTRLVLAELSAGRFNATAGKLAFQQPAGSVRAEVRDSGPAPLALETPYGTAALKAGDYVVAVEGTRAQVLVRDGAAAISVYADVLPLQTGERALLAVDAPAEGPFQGAANLLHNGDFAAGLADWEPRDTQEANRPDRRGQRQLVREVIDDAEWPALRINRASAFQTHNETGLVQQLNADVAVYPRLRLSARVKVRAASLSGGGYLGTEYPLMLRLRYRDAVGNGQIWYRGYYYENPELRPVDRGETVPRDAWTRVEIDLTQLPERPVFLYALEVVGAGHDFDALITDLQLVAD